jgi:putative chitinase
MNMNTEDLQSRLSALGFYRGRIDGDYGPVTRAAVMSFQRSRELKADGIAGPITLAAMNPGAQLHLTPRMLAEAAHIPLAKAERWLGPITSAMLRSEINTPGRAAAFIAHASHESQRFERLRENLDYTSPERILEIFPKYIYPNEVSRFVRRPERLANRVYARRGGNGDEDSGDGFKYRGGGLFHLTGRKGYRECGDALGIDLANHPEMIEQPEIAALTAGWYWHDNNLNALADSGDFKKMTLRINGGLNGYEDRLALWASAKKALSVGILS